MSEMIERARAAVESEYADIFGKRISSENARRLTSRVMEAMIKPTPEMLAAANALPVTELVNVLIAVAEMRYGGSGVEPSPNTPIEQWWRAMVRAALNHKSGDQK